MTRSCRSCGRSFPNGQALDRHMGKEHPGAARRRGLAYPVAAALLVAVAGGAVALFFVQQAAPPDPTPEARFHVSQSARQGNEGASVFFIAFESPQCPSCRIFHEGTGSGPSAYETILADYVGPGKVLYVEKTMYIGEPWEKEGAQAQKCVWNEHREAFWDLTAGFYRDQFRITKSSIWDYVRSWADRQGLDGDGVVECAKENRYGRDIARDVADARDAGVGGTPTFIVVTRDGAFSRFVSGPQPVSVFQAAIEGALAEAAGA